MKLLKLFLVALLALWLQAGDRAQQIADILRSKAGKTLTNTVLFVNYGPGAFDWLVVSPDGKFAAKLEGMNADGTFRYTILGDPAQYGLKFDVSLNGVKISTTSYSFNQSYVQKTTSAAVKSIVGETVSMITNLATGVNRELQTPSLLQLALRNLQSFRVHTTRYTETKACPQGGSISASYSSTTLTLSYNSCMVGTSTINGKLYIQQTSAQSAKATYKNFSIQFDEGYITLPSATLDLNLDAQGNIRSYTFFIKYLKAENYTKDSYLELRNYTIDAEVNNKLLYTTVNGDINTDCLEEWTHIKTLSTIIQHLYEVCPQGGRIRATNNQTDIIIVFNKDGSVEVLDNQTREHIKHYKNCLEAKDEECQ